MAGCNVAAEHNSADRTGVGDDPCPVEAAVGVIGGKWKVLILWHLQERGTLRFAELQRAVGGVTQKVLSQQLRELERDGVITRRVYPEVPPRVEYALSSLGTTLRGPLDVLCEWGELFLGESALRPSGPTAVSAAGDHQCEGRDEK